MRSIDVMHAVDVASKARRAAVERNGADLMPTTFPSSRPSTHKTQQKRM